jgi:DNA-binding MarR family transcriptional regulator
MSDVMEKDVREIKYKVDGIEKSVDLLLRANRKQIIEDLMAFFGKSKDRVKVFLAIDGEKSVNQIAEELKMKDQNVSKRITELEREVLIRVKKTVGHSKIYEQTEKVAILNLRKELQKKFGELVPAETPSEETGMKNVEEQKQG